MKDVRTINQNRKLWWLLNELGLKESVGDLVSDETGGRTRHTSELSFIECMNLIRRLEQYTRKAQEHPAGPSTGSGTGSTMDRKRKGVIKAICAYGELRGKKWDADYAKGIATRAAGRDRFGELTEGDLTRVYNEFCRKQTAAKAVGSLELGVRSWEL